MKKLNKVLFGFGSVAAVVAPVAAAVACGDADKDTKFDTTTIKSAEEFKAYAAKFGYNMTDDIAKRSFTEFGGTPTHAITVKAYKHITKPGKEKNIAILVTGTQAATAAEVTDAQKATMDEFTSRWEFSKADLTGVNFVAFLHTHTPEDKKAKNMTKDHSISWLKIQKDSKGQLAVDDVPSDLVNNAF